MIQLQCEQVLHLHQQMITATGGAFGVRDQGALDSALRHAFASYDGVDLYPTVESKAARQCFAIISNHPFVDGNKRTGLFVMLVFLELRGTALRFSQGELVALGFGVADSSLNADDVLQWIRTHMSA